MRRCVIVGGAEIRNYDIVRKYLKNEDFYIFCDCGLQHREALKILPDLIVGDFDSYPEPESDTEKIVLPCEKDDTDTVFAVKEAIKRGFNDFLLIGVIGGRLDHTIGNVSVLLTLDSLGKHAQIVDDYSEMQIISSSPASVDDSFAYFSLLNISGNARNITIKNAKYPLQNAEITCEYQYGISNEVIPGSTAEVSVGEGRLLLIKVR